MNEPVMFMNFPINGTFGEWTNPTGADLRGAAGAEHRSACAHVQGWGAGRGAGVTEPMALTMAYHGKTLHTTLTGQREKSGHAEVKTGQRKFPVSQAGGQRAAF